MQKVSKSALACAENVSCCGRQNSPVGCSCISISASSALTAPTLAVCTTVTTAYHTTVTPTVGIAHTAALRLSITATVIISIIILHIYS